MSTGGNSCCGVSRAATATAVGTVGVLGLVGFAVGAVGAAIVAEAFSVARQFWKSGCAGWIGRAAPGEKPSAAAILARASRVARCCCWRAEEWVIVFSFAAMVWSMVSFGDW